MMQAKIFFLVVFLLLPRVANAVGTYHVGNSLTADTVGLWSGSNIVGLEGVASLFGKTLDAGWHVDSGQSLDTIWNDPGGLTTGGVNLSDPSTWPNALAGGGLDYVTLQPHDSSGSTLGSDRQSIDNFIGATAGDPTFYILQTWPSQARGPYSSYWNGSVVDAAGTLTQKRRGYFDLLMEDVRADNPNATIWMAPMGEVMYELDQQIIAGTLPGVSSMSFFYRDNVHLDLGVGRWLAAKTLSATMFQQNPLSTGFPAASYLNGTQPSPALVDAVDEIIWKVVSANQWSGYFDYDRDGHIDGADLVEWNSSYGPSRNGGDFLGWQRQFQEAPAASTIGTSTIPEPSTAVLLLLLIFFSVVFMASQRKINANCPSSAPICVALR